MFFSCYHFTSNYLDYDFNIPNQILPGLLQVVVYLQDGMVSNCYKVLQVQVFILSSLMTALQGRPD